MGQLNAVGQGASLLASLLAWHQTDCHENVFIRKYNLEDPSLLSSPFTITMILPPTTSWSKTQMPHALRKTAWPSHPNCPAHFTGIPQKWGMVMGIRKVSVLSVNPHSCWVITGEKGVWYMRTRRQDNMCVKEIQPHSPFSLITS